MPPASAPPPQRESGPEARASLSRARSRESSPIRRAARPEEQKIRCGRCLHRRREASPRGSPRSGRWPGCFLSPQCGKRASRSRECFNITLAVVKAASRSIAQTARNTRPALLFGRHHGVLGAPKRSAVGRRTPSPSGSSNSRGMPGSPRRALRGKGESSRTRRERMLAGGSSSHKRGRFDVSRWFVTPEQGSWVPPTFTIARAQVGISHANKGEPLTLRAWKNRQKLGANAYVHWIVCTESDSRLKSSAFQPFTS